LCKRTVTRQVEPDQATTAKDQDEPSRKKFKFLVAKQHAGMPSERPAIDDGQAELPKYLLEMRNSAKPVSDVLSFWINRQTTYPLLSALALDLVAAPASQAYVERIFSVCGFLTTGRRNRMEKSLEIRVFLKLNAKLLDRCLSVTH
jgi:hypothetical protein